MKVISNATPLISLAVCGHFDLLRQLFSEIIVPSTVYHEVIHDMNRPGAREVAEVDWLKIVTPTKSPTIEPLLLGLDAGEMSVLLLVQETKPDWVLIDERRARRVAHTMKIPVKGTIGLLLSANIEGLLTKEETLCAVDDMIKHGIYISSRWRTWLKKNTL